jgi:predicted nucleic acid-binding protein
MLVLDTNALRRGHFSTKALRQWIEAVGEDADILIPEVVIWEWAEHAASAHTTLQSQLQEFRVDPGLYKRPTLADQVSIESLVDRITGLLPNSIRVWSAPDSVWKRAIMDQVLQIGSGERKEGVKTGAADSVVLACVQEQVDDRRNAEAILLATKDTRLKANCSRLFGEEVLLAESPVALLERLNAFEPAEQELYEATEEVLRGLVTDTSSDIGAALDTFDMGFRIHVSEKTPGPPYRDAPFRELARLGRVDIVELHDLRVANRDKEGPSWPRRRPHLRRCSHDRAPTS